MLILDVSPLTIVCDYFVICHGLSLTHVRAIFDGIDKELRAEGYDTLAKDVVPDAKWAVLDYGSVVVHVFTAEARQFYNLEGLWGSAPTVRRQEPEGTSAGL